MIRIVPVMALWMDTQALLMTLGVLFIVILLTATAWGVVWLGIAAVREYRLWKSSLSAIGKMAPAADRIATELTLLRSIFAGQQQTVDGSEPQAGAQPFTPTSRPPFPTAPPNFYPAAARVEEPDATMEDTVIDEGDDAEFKEQEELETVRNRGFEAE